MGSLWYLFAAFALFWVVILGYLVLLSQRQRRVESEIRHLSGVMPSADQKDRI